MAQVYFDTLKFVKTLESAGVPTLQAEAFSNAVRDSHEAVDVATQRDLKDLRVEMENRFDKIEEKIERQSMQLTVKFGGMLVVAVGVLAAIIKFPI